MKIGLDFDGVISDCGKLKSFGAKKLYGIDITPAKFKKEIVVGEGYLTIEQYRELQKIIYGTWKVGFLMQPVNGVLDFLPRLIADGHDLVVVTSRDGTELEIAKKWSIQQGLSLSFIGVGYANNKAEAARGLDVYIDDDIDKLEPLVGVVKYRYLFSWDYNVHIETGNVAKRIASWSEFYHIISTIGGIQ